MAYAPNVCCTVKGSASSGVPAGLWRRRFTVAVMACDDLLLDLQQNRLARSLALKFMLFLAINQIFQMCKQDKWPNDEGLPAGCRLAGCWPRAQQRPPALVPGKSPGLPKRMPAGDMWELL